MSSIAEIRHHIHVVEDTSKITRAMHLISSAKMKKAMRMYEQNKLYFQRVRSDIRFIIENTDGEIGNPYFRQHPGRRAAYIVVAGDKGLCGGYNADVLKLARRTMESADHASRTLFTIGHMANDYFSRLGMEPDVHYLHISEDPNLQSTRQITSEICSLFRGKYLDEVYIVYTQMKKLGVMQPRVLRVLPVLAEDFQDAAILHAPTNELVYHPSPFEVLEQMVPHYLVGLIYSALVQSFASENCARMAAMDAATRNAGEMLANLRQELNHARQTVITQEISEIISGSL